jgi:Histone acetyltransferase (MYST family)
MGKITRWGFLAAAASVLSAALLSGCGADTRENLDLNFIGAYGGGEWIVTTAPNARQYSTFREIDGSGNRTGFRTLTFTVDIKGRLLGSFTSNTGLSYVLEGYLNNDRQFDATLRSGDTTYPVSGYFSKQGVPQEQEDGTDTFASGLAGDFKIQINGEQYAGTFFASGGTETE